MRVIVVHTLDQTKAALRAASELNAPVTLQSAPDALFYAGSQYLLEMFEQARAAYPGAQANFVLDCADARGEAVAALQDGHMLLRSSAPEAVRGKLADIARANGAELVDAPAQALDLQHAHDAQAACREWLQASSPRLRGELEGGGLQRKK